MDTRRRREDTGRREDEDVTKNGYKRPELLAEPDWLWEHRDDRRVRIVDCTGGDVYQRAHIPGAVRLAIPPFLKTEPDPTAHLNEPLHVLGADDFAIAMGKVGISSETTVVAYDSVGNHLATRLWWVLRYYGHREAKVLNGGFHRWLVEGRPMSDAAPEIVPTTFTPRLDEAQIVRVDELLARHADADVQVVNVLWPDFYEGRRDPFGNRRQGHIPGSVNLPFTEFLTNDERRVFKPAAELAALAERAGLRPDRETVVHCQAGIATTLGVFVLSLLGWDDVRCYDAAMGEWANRDDTPLVVGEAVTAS